MIAYWQSANLNGPASYVKKIISLSLYIYIYIYISLSLHLIIYLLPPFSNSLVFSVNNFSVPGTRGSSGSTKPSRSARAAGSCARLPAAPACARCARPSGHRRILIGQHTHFSSSSTTFQVPSPFTTPCYL